MSAFTFIKSMFTPAPRFSPRECSDRVRRGDSVLVDVREPGEWTEGVAQGAKLLALSDLTGERTQWKAFLAGAADREILVYCASGGRSGMAARMLVAEGFRAANTGGLVDWIEAGWPVQRPARNR